eukprot:3873703-Alexandrium_andersonii.AAC.1
MPRPLPTCSRHALLGSRSERCQQPARIHAGKPSNSHSSPCPTLPSPCPSRRKGAPKANPGVMPSKQGARGGGGEERRDRSWRN